MALSHCYGIINLFLIEILYLLLIEILFCAPISLLCFSLLRTDFTCSYYALSYLYFECINVVVYTLLSIFNILSCILNFNINRLTLSFIIKFPSCICYSRLNFIKNSSRLNTQTLFRLYCHSLIDYL